MTYRSILFIILLATGLLFLWLTRRGQVQGGLPQGRVIYADTRGWDRLERPLFSHEFLLTGRPDYLVAAGADIIPVEVKSGRSPAQPYLSHVLQLAAYCLLVEECYGRRPAYGIVKYTDRAFELDYTAELEDELLATMDGMRCDLAAGDADRSHDEPRRCQTCGYRERCDRQLI